VEQDLIVAHLYSLLEARQVHRVLLALPFQFKEARFKVLHSHMFV
jgi:hypothetical protein